MRKIDGAALALLIVGGLNWGLVAIARFDLVAAIFGMDFGETSAITRVVYGLVGVSALWVFLGGLGDDADDLSSHLESRHETGRVLAEYGPSLIELRAGIVIGKGSASYRM